LSALSAAQAVTGVLAYAHLSVLDYGRYLRLAETWAAWREAGRLPDLVVTTTHLPVVTVGRDSPDPEAELRVSAWRGQAGPGSGTVGVHLVGRGGRATYHGPGQLMVYPVVDLAETGLGPVDFADRLLEAARLALGEWGLGEVRANQGLWAGGAKLAAVGLEVRRGITRHGLAVCLGPEPGPGFALVHPCGTPGLRLTNLADLTGARPNRRGLGRSIATHFARLLGRRPAPLASEELLEAKPPWLVTRQSGDLRPSGLPTVCAAADCPNQARCALEGRVTYLVLGPGCTRACAFCRVPAEGERPASADPSEPERIARAVADLATQGVAAPGRGRKVVVTSVTRDDLPDGGAGQFAAIVRAIRRQAPGSEVEVLVPDFRGDPEALRQVIEARPDVIGHNLETVPRLYPAIRPGAGYARSLALVAGASASPVPVRSGLLLGMGEETGEVIDVIRDLAQAGCRRLWLGQYLRPSPRHHPVARYASPAEFDRLAVFARSLGFTEVSAGPLVRSSCSA
jgi:lipoic acid synthetase